MGFGLLRYCLPSISPIFRSYVLAEISKLADSNKTNVTIVQICE